MWIPYGDHDGEVNWEFVKQIFIRLGMSHVKSAFLARYNPAFPEDKFRFYCPNIETKYVLVWKSCSQIGLFVDNTGQHYWWELRSCNDEVCCRQRLDVCWDNVNNQMSITESWDSLFDNCDPNPAPIPGAIWSSQCLSWCWIN